MRAWVVLSVLAWATFGCDARPPDQGGSGGAAATSRASVREERVSAAGLYRVVIAPETGAIPLGTLHTWVVEVTTTAGEPVVPTRLAFDGGMPQHGHGLPTAQRVTRSLGGGRFLVEGVKFNMGGDWTLRVEVVGPPGADVAVFHVYVEG